MLELFFLLILCPVCVLLHFFLEGIPLKHFLLIKEAQIRIFFCRNFHPERPQLHSKQREIKHCQLTIFSVSYFIYYSDKTLSVIIPPPQTVGGGYTGFALSHRSVGPSVRPSSIRVRSINPLLIEGFPSNLNDTLTSIGDVQSPCCPCVSSRSRSQLNVKY